MKETVYTLNGYDSRKDYLNQLADNNGVDKETVYELAAVLGASEDFDGLVTTVEDVAAGYYD